MSLPGVAADLGQAWKTASLAWEEARAEWNDAVSHDFEENHWAALEARVLGALQAMDRLSPVLARALSDTSE